MLLRDFIDDLNITTECKLVKADDKGFDWKVTLKLDGREIKIRFRCRTGWQEIHVGRSGWRDATWRELRQIEEEKKYGVSTLKKLRPKTPTALDVLQSLHCDVQSVQNSISFRNWANNLGYHPDSIKARKIYRACLKNDRKLRRLLSSRYYEFMACEED